MRLRTTEKRRRAQESLRILPGLLAERAGGGFAGSPDVPACALGPRIVYSLHAGYRVECETSGLARLRLQTIPYHFTGGNGEHERRRRNPSRFPPVCPVRSQGSEIAARRDEMKRVLAVTPVRQAHPFDRLRMTLSGVEWVSAPSKVEGLARPLRSGGTYHVLNRGNYRADVLKMSAVKGLSARMGSTSTP